jgi:hypothetical protein
VKIFTLRPLYVRYSQNRKGGAADTGNTADIVVTKIKTPA